MPKRDSALRHAPPEIVIGGPALAPFDLRVRSVLESGLNTAPGPISLVTTDGIALAGLHWPSSTSPPVAVVVLVHGLAARKDHPHIRGPGRASPRNGFEVLSYDARGHGASAGTFTLGHLEHLDVEAAAAWARERDVPTILVGASLGGVAALRYACDHPELTGVVIVSSPAGWRIPLRVRALLSVGSRSYSARSLDRPSADGCQDQFRMDGGRSTST